VNGAALTIVGVAPPGFDYPQRTDLWAPTTFDWKAVPRTSPAVFFRTVGRLHPQISWSQARSAFEADVYQQIPELRDRDAAERPALVPLRDQLAGPVRQASLLLMAGVALLLMLACANIANLLLARTVGRSSELRIRTPLGASRARLVQQLLTEAVLLALAASTAGLLVAWWTTQLATTVQPAQLASQAYTLLDWRVLAFAVTVAVATALLFGLGPALYALATDFSNPGHAASAAHRFPRTRTLLVAAQITVTLVLLTGAFALGRAFLALLQVDNGYQLRSIATMTVSLAGTGYEDSSRAAAYYGEVLRKVREV
jgi:putative ABC transport system permease protein